MTTNTIDNLTELVADEGKYITEVNPQSEESQGFYKKIMLSPLNSLSNYIEVDASVKEAHDKEIEDTMNIELNQI